MSIEKIAKWYIIYTYPNQEKKIYKELCKRRIDAFLPLTKKLRKWSDRNKLIEIPLFLNYVFVNISQTEHWKVLMVDGVSKFISFNGEPAIIKEEVIDYIKKMTFVQGDLKNEKLDIIGEKVKVIHGPLTGLEGKIMDIKGNTRLYVSLDSIGQIISLDINASDLIKIV